MKGLELTDVAKIISIWREWEKAIKRGELSQMMEHNRDQILFHGLCPMRKVLNSEGYD